MQRIGACMQRRPSRSVHVVVVLLGLAASPGPLSASPDNWSIGMAHWSLPATDHVFQTVYWLNPNGTVASRPAQLTREWSAGSQLLMLESPGTPLGLDTVRAGFALGVSAGNLAVEKDTFNIPMRSAGVSGEFVMLPSAYSQFTVENRCTLAMIPVEVSFRWRFLRAGVGGCFVHLEKTREVTERVQVTYGSSGEFRAGDVYRTNQRSSLIAGAPMVRLGVAAQEQLFRGVSGGISINAVYLSPVDNVIVQETVLNVAWSDRPPQRRIVHQQNGLRLGGLGFSVDVNLSFGGPERGDRRGSASAIPAEQPPRTPAPTLDW